MLCVALVLINFFILQNYSGIVDFQERICYVMRLNRAKITPPKDWMDLIRKFAVSILVKYELL